MFTGIIAATGIIAIAEHSPANTRLVIDGSALGMDEVRVGDSIAVNGVCLTVTEKRGGLFGVDVSKETLACTTGLVAEARVNLEKSLRFGDRVDGHLVSGHVDGVGEVVEMRDLGASWQLGVNVTGALGRYVAKKGSVTVNGVSLTVNEVANDASGCTFVINIIPHTLAVTTLGSLRNGSLVNVEVDLMARYIERMLNFER